MKYKCSNCGHVFEGQQPYCSQCGHRMTYSSVEESKPAYIAENNSNSVPRTGNYALGFVLGFFLGLIGLIIAIVMNEDETKRGGIVGFLVSIVLGGGLFVIIMLIAVSAL